MNCCDCPFLNKRVLCPNDTMSGSHHCEQLLLTHNKDQPAANKSDQTPSTASAPGKASRDEKSDTTIPSFPPHAKAVGYPRGGIL